MKKKIIYIAVITVFFALQIAKCKTIWQEIKYQKENIIDLYFDTSSPKINGDYVYYRTRTKFIEDDFVCWLKSDCKKNLTSILKCKPYSREVEEKFYNYEDSKKMRSFDSTSAMYLYHNNACQIRSLNKPKTDKVIQKKHNINWGVYMRNLEKQIKSVWNPPKQGESNEVVVGFNVEKDGKVNDLKIIKSSKDKKADDAALEAVMKAAPLESLPEEFIGNSVPIEFTFNYNVIYPNKIKKQDIALYEAAALLEDCPLNTPYKAIQGNNPTKKAIILEFKNLKDINDDYKNFDAIGWSKDDRLYIFVNKKYINAPKEALAAIIAGRSVHIDEKDSINEEIYAWAVEGYVWKYLSENTKIENPDNLLVKREMAIVDLIEKLENGKALVEYIDKDKTYQTFDKTSKGFSDKQFKVKFKKIMDLYNEI